MKEYLIGVAIACGVLAIVMPLITWIAVKLGMFGKLSNSPRQFALVKMADRNDFFYVSGYFDPKDNVFIYLGEIPNMLGHCIVVGAFTGKVYSRIHIDNFVEITE